MSRQIVVPKAGGVSLVYAHKITIRVQGNTVSLIVRKREDRAGGGVRGGVGEWSRGSRNRLIAMLNKMVFASVQFVTLTFHRNLLDADEGKKRLRAFTRSLRSKRHIEAGVWKQERQERGALHYHLMIFDAEPLDGDYIADLWNRASGESEDDADHLRYGSKVEKTVYAGTVDGGLVVSYFTKYMVKDEKDYGYKNGRVWGQWGCAKKFAAAYEKEIDPKAFSGALRGILSAGGRLFDNDSATGCKLYLGAVGCQGNVPDDLTLDDLVGILRSR